MAFAQLAGRESLRDIESSLRSFGPKLYHAGFHAYNSDPLRAPCRDGDRADRTAPAGPQETAGAGWPAVAPLQAPMESRTGLRVAWQVS